MAAKGLAFLLREGITTTANLAKLKGDITDRRKTDMLEKRWCVRRLIIELNVIMYVFCAVTMDTFLWMKPHGAGWAISLSLILLRHDIYLLIYTMDKYGSRLRASTETPGP